MLADIRSIVATDRWNSFDRFHDTASFIEKRYAEAGAVPELYRVPTGGAVASGRWIVQEASDVLGATIDILSPVSRRIADFRMNPWHVTQWSAATPPGGVTGRLIVIDTDEALQAVPANSLRGAILLTRLSPWYRGADFARTGAEAVITDNPPQGAEEGDPERAAVSWAKLGWSGMPLEMASVRIVCMTVSTSRGDALRRMAEKGREVRLKVAVDVRRYVGTHDLAMGKLVGAEDPQDEVWAIAHSAEPGALDNASGVAVCIEAARILQSLIHAGSLKRPRRTIRFLNGYECYSFFHYFEHERRLQPPLAGLNVDTVGSLPKVCGGLMAWHDTAGPSAWFVNDVGEAVLRAALRFRNPGYRLVRQPFHSTEDTLLGDPKYGFPCPWVSTHFRTRDRKAFRAYHSSGDTPALVSAAGLEMTAAAVAAYLYILANTGTEEMLEFAHSHTQSVLERIAAEPKRGTFIRAMHAESMRRLPRWMWGGDRSAVLKALSGMERDVRRAAKRVSGKACRKSRVAGMDAVAFRTAPLAPDPENIKPEVRAQFVKSGLGKDMLFWADGRRTLAEISELYAAQTEKPADPDCVKKFFIAMENVGYAKVVAKESLVERDRLVRDLRRLGLRRGMDVILHSSLSRIGWVRGGAEAVIDALLDVLGSEGTLMMPSFNHGQAKVFNPHTTPTINGAIPDAFWRRPGVVRSMHGSHAVAASGPRAEAYCRGHLETGIWGPESPIGRLVHAGGTILALGASLESATAYHVAEVSVPCRCLDTFGGSDRVVDAEGNVRVVPGLVWRGGDCPVSTALMEPALVRSGKLTKGKVGAADACLVKAKDLWQVRRRQLRKVCPTCKVRPDPGWKRAGDDA